MSEWTVISNGIVNALGKWIKAVEGAGSAADALVKVVVYLGLAAVLIAGMRGLQYLWVRSGTPPSKAPAPRPTLDPSEPDN